MVSKSILILIGVSLVILMIAHLWGIIEEISLLLSKMSFTFTTTKTTINIAKCTCYLELTSNQSPKLLLREEVKVIYPVELYLGGKLGFL